MLHLSLKYASYSEAYAHFRHEPRGVFETPLDKPSSMNLNISKNLFIKKKKKIKILNNKKKENGLNIVK